MGIPILGAISLITKVVSAVLPNKTKEVIDTTVNSIITTDKEIQEWIKQQTDFILSYEGKAESMPKVVNIMRAIPRLFITIGLTSVLIKDLWLGIPVPEKLWYLTGGICGFYFWLRHKEKMNGV